ncbi:MAG: peptide-methionine (S)-S-oxide reductase MsrA [Fusobacteriota bacterium]
MKKKNKKAIFAGGCFWCMENPFRVENGVIDVTVGYTGGETKNPTYEEVCTGTTGHYEAIMVEYDPDEVTFERLIDIFWKQIDPTDEGGQFADRGSQYETVIFYKDKNQEKIAKKKKKELDESGKFKKEIATKILPAEIFYPAEDNHQKYYLKNPTHFNMYKKGSGRADYQNETWGGKDE